MNKKILIAAIFPVYILTVLAANIATAQVPSVPDPVCVPAPGIPCPDDLNTAPANETPTPPSTPEKSGSQTFNDLAKSLEKMISGTADQIYGGLTSIFDGVKNFFQDIKF